MVTDRQDLDGQLFGVFAGAGDLLGESPKQADSRQELRELLGNRRPRPFARCKFRGPIALIRE
jgi:type I site-specific restriction-modification system R (restriction) subunit